MPNLIFRGPITRQPRTVDSKGAAAAGIKPGTWVAEGAATISQLTAFANGARIAADRDYVSGDPYSASDPLKDTYAINESIPCYVPEPGDMFLCAFAAATYTYGQDLTIAASGRLANAAAGSMVVAQFRGTPGALAAGDLADVEIVCPTIK